MTDLPIETFRKRPVQIQAMLWDGTDERAAAIKSWVGRIHPNTTGSGFLLPSEEAGFGPDSQAHLWVAHNLAWTPLPIGHRVVAELDGSGFYPLSPEGLAAGYAIPGNGAGGAQQPAQPAVEGPEAVQREKPRPTDSGAQNGSQGDASVAAMGPGAVLHALYPALRTAGVGSAASLIVAERLKPTVSRMLAEARAAGRREADNAISWHTDCIRCAAHLERDYDQFATTEQATRNNVAAELHQLAEALPEHAVGIRHAASYVEGATMVADQAIPGYVQRVTGNE